MCIRDSTISDETIDISSIMGMRGEIVGELRGENGEGTENRTGVYADYREIETSEKITSSIVENNLTEFKKYLDDPTSEIQQYLGKNGIVYTYDVDFSVYSYDADGTLIDSDSEVEESSTSASGATGQAEMMRRLSSSVGFGGSSSTSAENFSELTAGSDGSKISPVITDSYDVLYGSWPEEYNLSLIHILELLTNRVYNAPPVAPLPCAVTVSSRFMLSDACMMIVFRT